MVDQIAERLGVSKVPVREAITRLTGEGWLESRPHAGPVLPLITPDEIRETALIRSALETGAVPAALRHHDATSLAALSDLLHQMDDAVEDFPRRNLELHTAVIAPAPHPRLKSMTVSLMERALHHQTVHRLPGYLDQAQAEHREIVDALTQRDPERASDLIKGHIMTAAERLAAFMEGD